jgi:hypothetical protein
MFKPIYVRTTQILTKNNVEAGETVQVVECFDYQVQGPGFNSSTTQKEQSSTLQKVPLSSSAVNITLSGSNYFFIFYG